MALDATATLTYAKPGRSSYKRFIRENMDIITHVAFRGVRVLDLRCKFSHPDVKTSPDGLAGLDDILYHVVRCGLLHETRISGPVHFAPLPEIRYVSGSLQLPESLVPGLLVAVIVADCNIAERTPTKRLLNLHGAYSVAVPMDLAWGKKREIMWLTEVVHHECFQQSDIAAAPLDVGSDPSIAHGAD
jgi:hypothetical protein